jgi:HAD superfamily hydrolase (TIGR01490 family)
VAKTPKKPAAAFFDVDNTLVRGSTSYQFAKAAYNRKFFPRKDFIAFAWHQIVFLSKGETDHMLSAIKDRALELVKGRSYKEMKDLVALVYEENIKAKVWPETARLAQQHIEAGREVWIITAAPQEMGEEIAKRLGLTGALGTVLTHTGDVLTGEIKGKPLHGKEKAKAIKKLAKDRGFSLKKSFAYSDSHNDLPMLTLVGHPVAVNPDKLLKIYAKSAGWKIYDFKRKELRPNKKAIKKEIKIGKKG